MDAKFTAAANRIVLCAVFANTHRRQKAKQATEHIVIWQKSVCLRFSVRPRAVLFAQAILLVASLRRENRNITCLIRRNRAKKY
jgi:hypothetical protein